MISHRILNFLTCVYTLMAFKYTLACPNDTDVATAFYSSKLVPDVTQCAPKYELQFFYPEIFRLSPKFGIVESTTIGCPVTSWDGNSSVQCRCTAYVEYPFGNVVYPGKKLSPAEVTTPPRVTFPANCSKYYTLVMVDPDIPILHNILNSEFRHWIVGNIPGDDVTAGETLVFYFSPIPPPLTGPHRYTFLVYEQNEYIRFNESKITLARFVPINEFVKNYGLGCPVFGNYFISDAKYLLGLK